MLNTLQSVEKFTENSTRVRLRMFMYILTIVLQFTNAAITIVSILEVTDDPELYYYLPFGPRLFTIWTLIMQIIHSVIGLYCDKNELDQAIGKGKKLENLRSFKDMYFCCYVWPSSWSCSIIFWFFYYYDGNLVKIRILNKIGNALTNHIWHTFILITVLWEVFLQPRVEPKSHKKNVVLALSTVAVYLTLLCYTYVTSGTWIYPFYDVSYGTIYFPLIHLATCLLTVGAYYAQWPISRITGLGKPQKNTNKFRSH